MANSHDNRDSDVDLPKTLIDALREADHVQRDIPAEVDQAILRDAHSYLDSMPRTVRRRRMFVVATAVSTICAGLLLFVALRSERTAEQQIAQQLTPAADSNDSGFDSRDIDRNGTINILDAYAMARVMETGDADDRWDFNRDGKLNDDDIRLVAMDAVTL